MPLIFELWNGDSKKRLKEIASNSVHGVICDPPYDLTNLSRGGSLRTPGSGPFGRITLSTKPKGFMGHSWDASGIAFDTDFWAEVLRILIPTTGILRACGATRTFHRVGKVLREVGFVDVSVGGWIYSSGMPKSLDVSKALDKHFGAKREIIGYKDGVGGENLNDLVGKRAVRSTKDKGAKGIGAYGVGAQQKRVRVPITVPSTEEAKLWAGYGTGEKPAWEPVLRGRKP